MAKNAPKFDTEHVNNVLADAIKITDALDEDENTVNAYDCTFIVGAKKNKKITCYPIVEWSEEDVWSFLKERNVPVNPLYGKGFKRVGCVGCPLGGFAAQRKELEIFPKYKENYTKAFDRMIEARKKSGKDPVWKNGRDCMNWWIGLVPIGQETLFDQLDEERSQDGSVVQE